jgi:hypothetical protein
LCVLGKFYHLSHAPNPFCFIFLDRVSCYFFCPVLASDYNPTYTSCVSGSYGCYHPAFGWDGVSLTFCLTGLKPSSSQSLPKGMFYYTWHIPLCLVWRTDRLLQSNCTTFMFPPAMYEDFNLSTFLPIFSSVFLIIAILSVTRYFTIVLICISLMVNDV